MNQYLQQIAGNRDYSEFLTILSGLSRLFSSGSTPYLDYRIVENLFCKCFEAVNLAREDSSYDALKWGIGIGLKTFVFNGATNKATNQKVAEFDALAPQLAGLDAMTVVKTVSQWRNTRITTADASHGVTDLSIYHVVARADSLLRLFVVPYDPIDVGAIRLDASKSQVGKSLAFTDSKHDYSFYYSKSTLLERFDIPPKGEYIDIPVTIRVDPYDLLRRLADNKYGARVVAKLPSTCSSLHGGVRAALLPDFGAPREDSVILPLYSTALHGEVSSRSGLNQWNAEGRPRDPNEVYIPIPQSIHDKNAYFFPARDQIFRLKLPNGSSLTAKVCQQGRKALMSNPNKALGKWLLRDVLRIPAGTVVTRKMLDIAGFDSIVVVRESAALYRLELSRQAHYCSYMSQGD